MTAPGVRAAPDGASLTDGESDLIASLFDAPTLLADVRRTVTAASFGDDAWRFVFEALTACADAGEAINPTTVAERLQRAGRLAAAGGIDALTERAENGLGAKAAHYAGKVAGNAKRRELRGAARFLDRAANDPSGAPDDAARLVGERLAVIAAGAAGGAEADPIDLVAAEAQGVPSPREWWVDEWLMPGPTLFAGAGGMGKSLVATMLGASLALGRDYFAKCCIPRTVLMWACEDDRDECLRRVWAAAEALGVPLSALGRLHVVPRVGLDSTLVRFDRGKPTRTTAFDELRRQSDGLGADVVILDNNAHTFGGNFMDRGEVTRFVSELSGMHGGRKVATILLHHVARAEGSEFGDSAAWENSVRMRWWLTDRDPDRARRDIDAQPEDTGARYLARRKANYSGRDVCRLRFGRGAMVAEQSEDGAIDAGVFRAIRARAAEDAVVESVRQFRALKIHVTEGNKGAYLPKKMTEYKFGRDFSRAELRDAMASALLANRIAHGVDGRNSNGNKRTGLVIFGEEDR